MHNLLSTIGRFLTELRRRKVYQVALAYLAAGFVVVELADIAAGAFGLPGWFQPMVWTVVGLGFPIALVMAWALEVTPDGVRVDTGEGSSEEAVRAPATPGLWVGASVLALVALGAWWMWGGLSGSEREGSGAVGPAAQDTVAQPRIAVLPFENIAPDSSDDHFARGMHEEVLNQLSKASGLEVLSRTSVMQYAETTRTVREISEELGGLSALLEGTVRRAGDQVRITTQLIAAPEDKHLWSKVYERELSVDAIFDIQADIAQNIARALETRLTETERRRIEDAPTSDLAAYDAFLRGRNQYRQYWQTLAPKQIDQAATHFREAIRRDPGFAEAHARLAEAYRQRASFSSAARWWDSTRVALERAREIDPGVPEIHWVQGFLFVSQDSLEAAAEAFQRALDLQPSNPIACSGLAAVRQAQGRSAEAFRWAHRAYRLEPRFPFRPTQMGSLLGAIGMLDAAEAWGRRAVELNPDHLLSVIVLAETQAASDPAEALATVRSYLDRHPQNRRALFMAGRMALWAGRPGAAKSYFEKALGAERQESAKEFSSRPYPQVMNWRDRMVLGLVELRLGHRERGRHLLRQARDTVRTKRSPPELADRWGRAVWLAGTEAALGRGEAALNILERSLSETAPVASIPPPLRANPFFEDLRSESRFQRIVREVESRLKTIREEVRQLDLDLYPPGARPDTEMSRPQTDA